MKVENFSCIIFWCLKGYVPGREIGILKEVNSDVGDVILTYADKTITG
jgi:hypothetical protein